MAETTDRVRIKHKGTGAETEVSRKAYERAWKDYGYTLAEGEKKFTRSSKKEGE